MTKFLTRWVIMTLATAITVWLVPGLHIVGNNKWFAYAGFALFMALINASIKPFMQAVSLPLSILSFGLVALIVNAVCFELAGALASEVLGFGLASGSFGWSLMGAVVLSIVSGILGMLNFD
ncbi:phage holin family protein [Alloscardovia venturai]|uniref:Phage holin family protein n=1 Tax=Alloscardovia venturai TaxID=1769421 RepID=A0ABW2Y5P2_9BIFI